MLSHTAISQFGMRVYCQIRSLWLEGGASGTICGRGSKPTGRRLWGALRMVAQEVEQQGKTGQSQVTPPPFSWRKLGSFEKMLTQTRDGIGPAEEGVRTLLTPHVWAAVIDGDLPRSSLKRGVEAVLECHPMLRACIRTPDGPKEPLINLIGEVRDDGDPLFFCEAEYESLGELAERVLAPEETEVEGETAFEREWQARLEGNLDNARLPVSVGPNWRLETIRLAGKSRTAIVCTMNHALEDQRSSNLMLDGILGAAGGVQLPEPSGSKSDSTDTVEFPPSMEMALIEGETFRANTMGYIWSQATAAISQPRVLPEGLPSAENRGQDGDDGAYGVATRKTACEFSFITEDEITAMLLACRERGQTLSQALSAASLMACSDVSQAEGSRGAHRYKFLMAVDLRRFGVGPHKGNDDWTRGTVACAGGAIDYVVKVSDGSGRKLIGEDGEVAARAARDEFWRLARRCKDATRDLVEKETAREAVAVFDWAMESMDIWASVNIESRNPKSLGRAYTCGLSNMGRYPFETQVGGLHLKAVHYGTSQSGCGSLFQLSCGTVEGKMLMTLQFAQPVISRTMAQAYLLGITKCLRAGCGIPPTAESAV